MVWWRLVAAPGNENDGGTRRCPPFATWTFTAYMCRHRDKTFCSSGYYIVTETRQFSGSTGSPPLAESDSSSGTPRAHASETRVKLTFDMTISIWARLSVPLGSSHIAKAVIS